MLSASVLSDLIKTALSSRVEVDDELELQKLTDSIAEAVVEHVTSAAVVTVIGITPGGNTTTGTIA